MIAWILVSSGNRARNSEGILSAVKIVVVGTLTTKSPDCNVRNLGEFFIFLSMFIVVGLGLGLVDSFSLLFIP
jgi:hypothetical protein